MLLQGPNINKYNKHLEQYKLTISQLIVQNVVKRTRKKSCSSYSDKARESPLSTYVGMMIHAKTRKKGVIEKLYDLGISIPYNRVLELSTSLGSTVLKQFQEDGVVCPRALKKDIFTTAALDNLDHDPTSSTSQSSFHGTGISLFQQSIEQTEDVEENLSLEKPQKLIALPLSYSEVTPISFFKQQPQSRDYSKVQDCVNKDICNYSLSGEIR